MSGNSKKAASMLYLPLDQSVDGLRSLLVNGEQRGECD